MAVRLFVALLVLAGLGASRASAHPHVWVVAREQILFAPDGKITGVRHSWTFDEMYSAFATQGLGRDGKPPTREQLAPLAKTNVESLAEFQYFTVAKTGPKFYEFDAPTDYELEADDKKLVTLRFTLPLKTPAPAQKPFTFMVYDPTYFVDFELATENPVVLKDAPSGCSLTTLRPEPLNASDNGKLSESFFSGLSPGADFGIKIGATLDRGLPMKRVIGLAALLVSTQTAAAQFARNPFSLGVDEGAVGNVGRFGLWLLQEQARFYQALRQAVEAAQANPAAAWSLVAVAFAYGVFHAAGPGHGKAVIASYMLANERALRRGMVLSALAALLQALVALAIVGVAALLLGATAQKMAAATQAVEVFSYGCIAVLGLWLVWRKGANFLAAWRAPRIAASSRFQCEDSAHEPGCVHCVAPDPALLGDQFSWRQGAATVVAAGSRPCSGALLVLVFALAQRAFTIGVWAVFAMAAGTALTTAALAASAVLAKGAMTKILGAQTRRADIFARGLEVLAACAVAFLGLSLLAGFLAAGRAWTL